jgi:hemoglobin
MKSAHRVGVSAVSLILVAVLCLTAAAAQDKPAAKSGKSLYHRMGGYDVIAAVVDDFLVLLRDDPAFKRFGGGRSKGSLQRARQLIVDQICAATGGPCVYFGRDMKSSHEGLAITDAEWESSVQKLTAALEKNKVGPGEQKEMLAIVETLRKDIVEKPKEEKAQAAN